MLLLVTLTLSIWKNIGVYKKSNERVVIILDPIESLIQSLHGDGESLADDKAGLAQPANQSLTEKISNFHIGALLLLTALNSLFIIFQYKKRMLQIKLSGLNYLLLSAILVSYYLAIKNNNDMLAEAGKGEFLIGFYVPIIAIILNFLVIKFIKKDEALVRSVDRIR